MIDKDNREQVLAYELIANTNSSFFLTGRAGTGKTTFLRNVQKMVDKQFITLAPTGVAAILAGGETIHSFFGLQMDVCTPGTFGNMNEARILALQKADTIIIDEVSMVRCDIVDAIDYTMRRVLRTTLPFGGKQVIFVGDMFQLPPVAQKGAERELLQDLYNTNDFFFYKADSVKRMRLAKIEFQKVYRQDEDSQFLKILENIRMNKVTPENIMHLNQRVMQPKEEDGMIITLTSINKTADKINQEKLDEIDSKDPKFKNIQRYTSLLTLLGDTDYLGTTTKIIAITDLPVDYSLNLESKSISNYNLTAVIQEANIDFKDESGNISFPEGYFSYTVSELDNRVDYDYYDGYIYGEGEIVLDYKIDDNVDVKEITINVYTDRWGYQYGLNGEYYIYNYNTNEYEEFKLTSGSYKVINDGSYSLNNIIKIKVVASENRDTAAPKLVIKGVEK